MLTMSIRALSMAMVIALSILASILEFMLDIVLDNDPAMKINITNERLKLQEYSRLQCTAVLMFYLFSGISVCSQW